MRKNENGNKVSFFRSFDDGRFVRSYGMSLPREDYMISSSLELPTWAHSNSETLV